MMRERNTQVCQSCAMPLTRGKFGTNEDNSESQEYCRYCYQAGKFTKQFDSVDDMLRYSKAVMERNNLPRRVIEMNLETIPTLKRWK